MIGRLRRSELSTPGSSAAKIEKAATVGADVVVLDLEDSVPVDEKERARALVIDGLIGADWGRTARACRINGVGTPWCHRDVTEVVTGAGPCLEVLVIPKVRRRRDIWFIDELLGQLEVGLGLPVGGIGLEVLVEEAGALARVERLARCCGRLEALTLGPGDLSASLGMRAGHVGVTDGLPYPGDPWHFARSRLVTAARAAGIEALDGPTADLANPATFRRDAEWARTLGAGGKWCIHPAQVAIANEVFSPTGEEIAEAVRVVSAARAAEDGGAGAVQVDGMMVDAATVRGFEVLLERARQGGCQGGAGAGGVATNG